MTNLHLLPRAKKPSAPPRAPAPGAPAPKPPRVNDNTVLMLALLLTNTPDEACAMLQQGNFTLPPSPAMEPALKLRTELKGCSGTDGALKVVARYNRRLSPIADMLSKKQQWESAMKSGNPMNLLLHAMPQIGGAMGNFSQLQGLMSMMQGMGGVNPLDLLSR